MQAVADSSPAKTNKLAIGFICAVFAVHVAGALCSVLSTAGKWLGLLKSDRAAGPLVLARKKTQCWGGEIKRQRKYVSPLPSFLSFWSPR